LTKTRAGFEAWSPQLSGVTVSGHNSREALKRFVCAYVAFNCEKSPEALTVEGHRETPFLPLPATATALHLEIQEIDRKGVGRAAFLITSLDKPEIITHGETVEAALLDFVGRYRHGA
jgi:hypothetical protein